jgi:ferritin-like metal-binding protein YciE
MGTTTQDAIHNYVTDMIALEDLLAKSVAAQVSAHDDNAQAAAFFRQVEATVDQHISQLKQIAESHDAGVLNAVGDAIKRGGSMLAGMGAAAMDMVRNEKLAKNLRDDATAFSLATTGYYMLHVTATALGETATANTARQFMQDYSSVVTRLHDMIPEAIIEVLREDELPIVAGVGDAARKTYREVWAQAG